MDKELKILIIEDVPRDAEAIEEELRKESIPFHAWRLETRAQFLAALDKLTPDIVLSDFTLPDFDALEALRLLKERNGDIPFILVTGSRSEEVAVECIKQGADDYILKASLKRLPSSVLSVLQKKAAQREKARTEAALRRGEEQFRLITENSYDLISLLDVEGRFIYASPAFRTGLGYVAEELAGTDSYALVHPDDRSRLRQALRQSLEQRAGRTAEYRMKHQTGEWRIFEAVGNWVFDGRGNPQRAVLVSRDITQRKEAEETLHGLPQLILAAQEVERHRVARELHDSVNQILSSVKFRLQTAEEGLLDRDEAIWREVLKAKALLDRAIQEVRRISRNLRPSELDDLGLAPAVRSLCNEFSERTGVRVELSFAKLPKSFPAEIELNLYRIIQEALNNIEKHSAATRVELRLSREGPGITATIRDNGRGFEPQLAQVKGPLNPGMGLMDMRERAAFIGGIWTLKSGRDAGTEVTVHVPLNSMASSRNETGEKGKNETNQIAAGG